MRRNDKEMTLESDMEGVIRHSLVCRLAMCLDGQPYVVPLCFGYRDGALYLHSAREGRKIDIIRQNPRVCFEMDVVAGLKADESACKWGMSYESIIGYGTAELLESPAEKRTGLDIIMSQYSDRSFTYSEDEIRKTAVIKVTVESMTGKRSI